MYGLTNSQFVQHILVAFSKPAHLQTPLRALFPKPQISLHSWAPRLGDSNHAFANTLPP